MLPKIFGIDSYILLAIVGFAAAFLTAVLRRKKYRYAISDLFAMLFAGIAGLLIGARALYIVTKLPDIINNFGWEIIKKEVINGGLVFYGGLIGAMIGIYVIARALKRNTTEMLGFVIPCFAAFHFFGRIGCFLSGCCHGVEWAHGVPCDAGFLCFPIQLVEAAGIAIIFVVLMILEEHGRKKQIEVPMMDVYFVLYGILRFVDEIWRGDVLRGVTVIDLNYFTTGTSSASLSFSLSTSQIISLILIVYSGVRLFKRYHKPKEKTN